MIKAQKLGVKVIGEEQLLERLKAKIEKRKSRNRESGNGQV